MAAKVETIHTAGRIEYTVTGDSKAEVQAAVSDILQSYHPGGYGTSFSTVKQEGDIFVSRGYRYKSAD